jgi:hypothetical protein
MLSLGNGSVIGGELRACNSTTTSCELSVAGVVTIKTPYYNTYDAAVLVGSGCELIIGEFGNGYPFLLVYLHKTGMVQEFF